jgi:hypothetical protein
LAQASEIDSTTLNLPLIYRLFYRASRGRRIFSSVNNRLLHARRGVARQFRLNRKIIWRRHLGAPGDVRKDFSIGALKNARSLLSL